MQEEPLFVSLVQKKYLKALNEALRDNGETVIVKDEIANKKNIK